MHVDDNTGKTFGQYGHTTIQERKATFHTTGAKDGKFNKRRSRSTCPWMTTELKVAMPVDDNRVESSHQEEE